MKSKLPKAVMAAVREYDGVLSDYVKQRPNVTEAVYRAAREKVFRAVIDASGLRR